MTAQPVPILGSEMHLIHSKHTGRQYRITGGPKPFAKADRSRFLQALDEALARLGR